MRTPQYAILCAALLGIISLPWLLHSRGESRLRAIRESGQQLNSRLAETAAENQQLSNTLASLKDSPGLNRDDLKELLKLRQEVGQARQATNQAETVSREIRRLRAGLADIPRDSQGIVLNGTLAGELEERRAKVAQVKQWLEDNPGEKIPELQFVPELEWIRLTDRPWVETDDENRHTLSMLRSKGEVIFEKMAYEALQQFAQSNQNQFPADLGQLRPYFDPPVDDAILSRYTVVPARSLNIPSLASAGDEWVITQRAPVNREEDARSVIRQGRIYHSSRDQGRWDPLK